MSLPSTISNIGGDIFIDCSGLTEPIIINGLFIYFPCTYTGDYTIPDNVTKIHDGAFEECTYLKSVTIPNSVTCIGINAFNSCTSLRSITISNSVTSIGSSAFYECSDLTSIIIPNSVTSIGRSAFMNCYRLQTINLPNNITDISESLFYNCSSLLSINIPDSIKSIGKYAFYGCENLTSINIPNSVTSIGDYVFRGCSSLKKIIYDCSINPQISECKLEDLQIGDNVQVVYDYFKNMYLKKIILGKNVTHIRGNAFASSNIEEFTITGEEPPYLYPNVFGTQDLSNATLYVPESKTEYYQTTEPWSKFGKILTLSGDTPSEPEKCATPSISFSEGQLQFSCETEGAKCYYTLNNSDVKTGETLAESKIVNLSACYDITCYAKAEGYVNSDVATAKLYWLPSSGTLEGDNINNVSMRGIAIQSAGGFINISGLDNNEKVSFYGIDGKSLGTATSINGTTSFSAQSGTIVVAKIGKESIKISVK